MAKDPTFPFYAQDYLIDTIRWDADMKSLHVDLLCEAWVNGWPEDENGHPFGLSTNQVQIWQKISHKWSKRKGFWVNIKLLQCKRKRNKFFKTQRANGLKGGRPRKPKETQIKPMGFKNTNPNETREKPFLEKEKEYIIQENIDSIIESKVPQTSKSKVVSNSKSAGEKKFNTEDCFLCDALKKAWCEWEHFRTEKRQSLKNTTRKKQITFLKEHSEEDAIKILEQSMMQGYTGLFELQKKGNNGNSKQHSNSKTAGINLAIEKLREQTGR